MTTFVESSPTSTTPVAAQCPPTGHFPPAGAAARHDALGRFLRQAAANPRAVAVVDDGTERTYARIAGAAAVLADRLRDAGTRPGDLVGLSVTRGWRVVVGILAVWLSGAAYVPIDPLYPEARRKYIAADARVANVIVDAGADTAVLALDPPGPPHRVAPGAAYVIYTSGSTGAPKGVVVRHENLEALLESADAVLPAGPRDAGTVFHSYCFDFSVWELWRVLGSGGRCVFVPAEASLDPDILARLLADHGITLLSLVPSVFANLVSALRAAPVAFPALREVVFGGEPVDLNAVRAWYALGAAPAARLVNMYGITETTVHVTERPLDPELAEAADPRATPIGRPLPHLRVRVLDADLRPVADGEAGEMYVAGAGVSEGYLGRPELTAERFVRLPGDPDAALWYRTGDLARRDPGGELLFLGRADAQVQIRGHRVEPAEIEAALCALPEVASAGVAAVPNRLGEPNLVAGYVPTDPAAPALPEARALRAALRDRLPGYMLPTRLLRMDGLPVTPEGKLDRRALAERVRPTITEGTAR